MVGVSVLSRATGFTILTAGGFLCEKKEKEFDEGWVVGGLEGGFSSLAPEPTALKTEAANRGRN